jgi:hypothetical protein
MQTIQKRGAQTHQRSEGNLALAEESPGVPQAPKVEPLPPVPGAAQDRTEEHPEVDAFALARGIIIGIGLLFILWCLINLIGVGFLKPLTI